MTLTRLKLTILEMPSDGLRRCIPRYCRVLYDHTRDLLLQRLCVQVSSKNLDVRKFGHDLPENRGQRKPNAAKPQQKNGISRAKTQRCKGNTKLSFRPKGEISL